MSEDTPLSLILSAPTGPEANLIAHAAQGTLCQLGPACPAADDPAAPRIRAALLAHLITGGSAEVRFRRRACAYKAR